MSASEFAQHPPECLSERTLDALHASALDADQTRAAREHLAGCASCRARLATIEAGFDAFPRFDARRALAQVRTGLAAKRRRRWWMPALLIGATAAALVVGLRTPPDPLVGVGPAARIKGKAALRLFKRTAEGSAEVGPDERLPAGTQIRFGVDLPAAGAVRVLARSGAQLVIVWPQGPAGPLPAGDGQVLSGAVQLDDAAKDEAIFLVHCPGLDAAPDCPLTGDAPACPSPCTVTDLIVQRR